MLDKEKITALIKGGADVIILEETDSTNNVCKAIASRGAKEKTIVIAKKQTQGRGRMGRSFISSSENGLYMTLLLRPRVKITECIDMTVIAAVSVSEAIEKITNKKCSVKWVNDVYVDNKKVSGILTEASCDFSTGLLDYAIVGIGVNVSEPEGGFDASIKDIACALYEKDAPCGVKNELCAEIVNRFFHYYENMADKCYMEKYRAYSNIIGKSVDVYRGNEVISGVCVDIDDCANLVVESDGRIIRFNSGDARVRRV